MCCYLFKNIIFIHKTRKCLFVHCSDVINDSIFFSKLFFFFCAHCIVFIFDNLLLDCKSPTTVLIVFTTFKRACSSLSTIYLFLMFFFLFPHCFLLFLCVPINTLVDIRSKFIWIYLLLYLLFYLFYVDFYCWYINIKTENEAGKILNARHAHDSCDVRLRVSHPPIVTPRSNKKIYNCIWIMIMTINITY